MANTQNPLNLENCYYDFECRPFSSYLDISRQHDLIRKTPSGRAVIRQEHLSGHKEASFTVSLQKPDKSPITDEEIKPILNQLSALLTKHDVRHSDTSFMEAALKHIAKDTQFLHKTQRELTDGERRLELTQQHFENRVDVTYKVPVEDLEKLTRAINELEHISQSRSGISR